MGEEGVQNQSHGVRESKWVGEWGEPREGGDRACRVRGAGSRRGEVEEEQESGQNYPSLVHSHHPLSLPPPHLAAYAADPRVAAGTHVGNSL